MAQLNVTAPKKVAYFNLITPVAFPMQAYWEMGGFEGEALAIGFDKWPEIKPTTPTGTMPFAEFPDGTAIGESGAIGRVLAAAGGFLGTGNDYAKSEMLVGLTADLNKKIMPVVPTVMTVDGFDSDKKAAFAEAKPGVLEFVAKYEKLLLPAGDRFTESGLTFGEMDLFGKIHCHGAGALPELTTGPLKAFYDRMKDVPAIKKVIDGTSKFGPLMSYLVAMPA